MKQDLMKGVIDMHVHTNPDLRLRAYDDFELMEAAIRVGARAIVIKTHQGTTMDRAYLCQSVEVVKDGKIVPELRSVLELIRDHNAVLGTAHIAPEEIFTVVEAARDMGVKNIVVTHPEWWIVGMSHEDQLRLVKDYDVILERCYAQNMGGGKYKSNLADNLELIKEVGYKNVMVDTDGGQTENPHWELALAEYMQYLVDHGIPEEHVYHMTHTIPAKLLGIEE